MLIFKIIRSHKNDNFYKFYLKELKIQYVFRMFIEKITKVIYEVKKILHYLNVYKSQ